MMKKLLATLVVSTGLIYTAQAQDFQITATPVDSTTAGTPVKTQSMEGWPDVRLVTYVKNVSANPITLSWKRATDSTTHPAGWLWTGECDNINCRSTYDAWYVNYNLETTSPVQPNLNCLFEARVYAPYTAPNGTGTFKVQVSTANQTDTIVYILNKNTTGITAIQADDKRVSLYPNPAVNNLLVYADKNLKATDITIINIAGMAQSRIGIEAGKEVTEVNVNNLATGMYLVKLTDAQGAVVTTRRFVKK